MKRLILIGLLLVSLFCLAGCTEETNHSFFCTETKYEVRTLDDKFIDNCKEHIISNNHFFYCDKGFDIDGSNVKSKTFSYDSCKEEVVKAKVRIRVGE